MRAMYSGSVKNLLSVDLSMKPDQEWCKLFLDKYVIDGNASLSCTSRPFRSDYPIHGYLTLPLTVKAVNDARAFRAKLKRDRRQVFRCFRHNDAPYTSITGEKDLVPSVLHELLSYLRPALYDLHGIGVQILRYVGGEERGG
ncbi:Os02g0646700 [Oryza sativa Japonica Group]|uniref:Os02g0646700 protein n=1 Tax=Oryza sativa subsp. japonica TaxID=39947 RepID=A0A0P0VME9_ORYSJ|nr:hypothetical protein EE612_012691 [Oryza sativa]BAS80030.1 Os02g0646700 [Oryza sativa Japonica Group]